jgi:hypothetical protein
MSGNENIIQAIEDRLKILEKEKDQIETMYGIDYNLINNFQESKKKIQQQNINSFKNQHAIYEKSPLPKLEVSKKKEIKNVYKTPEYLKESLRYEPNIKDLWTEKNFEPSFSNLKSLKTTTILPRGDGIYNYISWLSHEFLNNYIE